MKHDMCTCIIQISWNIPNCASSIHHDKSIILLLQNERTCCQPKLAFHKPKFMSAVLKKSSQLHLDGACTANVAIHLHLAVGKGTLVPLGAEDMVGHPVDSVFAFGGLATHSALGVTLQGRKGGPTTFKLQVFSFNMSHFEKSHLFGDWSNS